VATDTMPNDVAGNPFDSDDVAEDRQEPKSHVRDMRHYDTPPPARRDRETSI
jgi:hypothetical protein